MVAPAVAVLVVAVWVAAVWVVVVWVVAARESMAQEAVARAATVEAHTVQAAARQGMSCGRHHYSQQPKRQMLVGWHTHNASCQSNRGGGKLMTPSGKLMTGSCPFLRMLTCTGRSSGHLRPRSRNGCRTELPQ